VGEGGVNGERGLVIVVSGRSAPTPGGGDQVEAALAQMRPAIERRAHAPPALFQPAEFIDLALRNITSLLLGAVLVSVVLFPFSRTWARRRLAHRHSPPLLAAILALDSLGFGINTLTLGGFAIAIGVVVDDAIIDVENILRRLRKRAPPGATPGGPGRARRVAWRCEAAWCTPRSS
jgi:multidrug efflux pump subunit AcrB